MGVWWLAINNCFPPRFVQNYKLCKLQIKGIDYIRHRRKVLNKRAERAENFVHHLCLVRKEMHVLIGIFFWIGCFSTISPTSTIYVCFNLTWCFFIISISAKNTSIVFISNLIAQFWNRACKWILYSEGEANNLCIYRDITVLYINEQRLKKFCHIIFARYKIKYRIKSSPSICI